MAAISVSGNLREIVVTENGVKKLNICKTIPQPPRPITSPLQQQSKSAAAFLWNSMVGSSSDTNSSCVTKTALFALQEGVVHVTVCVDATCVASMDARYILATAQTRISANMARRTERVTKKQPPPTVAHGAIFLSHFFKLQRTHSQAGRVCKSYQQQQQYFDGDVGATAGGILLPLTFD